jgi:hypothetical protein
VEEERVYAQLIAPVDPEPFRKRLLRWIVHYHISFESVTSPEFIDMIVCAQPAMAEEFIVDNRKLGTGGLSTSSSAG